MNDPYPRIDGWILPAVALSVTRKGVQEEGQGVREAGALWLGTRQATACVRAIVFLTGRGVEATAGRWKVSPEVFGVVMDWAKPRGLCLLGVVHTHLRGVAPRLSRADREYSFQVPGILAVVIGEGGNDQNHVTWGWYVYEGTDYRRLHPEEWVRVFIMSSGMVEVRRASADKLWEPNQP